MDRHATARAGPSLAELLHLAGATDEEFPLNDNSHAVITGRKDLLGAFKSSDRFQAIYEEAVRLYLGADEQEFVQITKEFVGALFESFGYLYSNNHCQAPLRILSPEKTFELYRRLYPRNAVVEHLFGVKSLMGITVPDGVIIEARDGIERIVDVCEYTSFGTRANFEMKREGFMINARNRQEILGDAHLKIFIPRGGSLSLHIGSENGIQVEELPFTHRQFRDFVEGMAEFYQRHEDSARIVDIKSEAAIQQARRRSNPTSASLNYLPSAGRRMEIYT